MGLLERSALMMVCSCKAYLLDWARALGCIDHVQRAVGKAARSAGQAATLAQCDNLRFLRLGYHGGMPLAKECVAWAELAFVLNP